MDFYKYIRKMGKTGYMVQKDGETYGTYTKLTDALYERDRLVKANWNWDDAVQLEETPNYYEKMRLPLFIHEYSYIVRVPQKYKVYCEGDYRGSFRSKSDAWAFARNMGGEVVESNITYRILKKIDGEQKYFGQFTSLDEAKRVRDELIENGWQK